MSRKRSVELKWWSVPYRATVQGTTQVEAETAEDARAQVESGVFDLDNGQEIVDWSVSAFEDRFEDRFRVYSTLHLVCRKCGESTEVETQSSGKLWAAIHEAQCESPSSEDAEARA